MATAERFLLDTNVLLEATDIGRRHHDEARTLIESGDRLVLAAQVIREYLAVATRPVEANGLGLATAHALENVMEFRRRLRLLPEERPVLPAFLNLLRVVTCRGKRIHDAHIIATALVHQVRTIVTLNVADLSLFADHVEALTPKQVLAKQSRARPGVSQSRARRQRSSPS
jgi:predicted nucleic acid-binding protein